MASFSRRVAGFQEVFPSSGVSFAQPTEVSEVVQLTHSFLAAGTRFLETGMLTVVGALNVTVIQFAAVPEGRYWYVAGWDGRHSGATAQTMRFVLEEPNIGTRVALQRLGSVPGSDDQSFFRPILIPAGWLATLEVDVLDAGAFLTTHIMRTEYPVAEEPPPF